MRKLTSIELNHVYGGGGGGGNTVSHAHSQPKAGSKAATHVKGASKVKAPKGGSKTRGGGCCED